MLEPDVLTYILAYFTYLLFSVEHGIFILMLTVELRRQKQKHKTLAVPEKETGKQRHAHPHIERAHGHQHAPAYSSSILIDNPSPLSLAAKRPLRRCGTRVGQKRGTTSRADHFGPQAGDFRSAYRACPPPRPRRKKTGNGPVPPPRGHPSSAS